MGIQTNPGSGGPLVAAKQRGSGDTGDEASHQIQVIIPSYSTGSNGAQQVASDKPLSVGSHRTAQRHELCSTTFAIANADGTNLKYVNCTLPPEEKGLGGVVFFWLRNTTDKDLVVQLQHYVPDPQGATDRWPPLGSDSGPREVGFAAGGDGSIVIFDGGLISIAATPARFAIRAAAAVTGSHTISVAAWMKSL